MERICLFIASILTVVAFFLQFFVLEPRRRRWIARVLDHPDLYHPSTLVRVRKMRDDGPPGRPQIVMLVAMIVIWAALYLMEWPA